MKYLSLQIPGANGPIPLPPGLEKNYPTNQPLIGVFLTNILDVVFLLALFLAFFWLVWGAFQYMVSSGDKQKLAQARSRIIWAIVGLILVAIAFLVAQFVAQVLRPTGGVPIL